MTKTNLEIEEVKRKWNCHQVGCDFNRKRIYGSNVCDMNCKNVFDGVLSRLLQQRMDEIAKEISYKAHFSKLAGSRYDGYMNVEDVLNIIKSVDKNK